MRLKNLVHPAILAGTGILLLLSLPFALTDLDLTIQSWFYDNGWLFGHLQPWSALYRYGTLPGLLLAIGALVVLIGSWIWPKLANKRRAAALLILTLIIGPGLLINVFGKGYWGRPRPRELTQFGGHAAFHRFYDPGTPGRGKSFPCGHASVGFFIVAMAFVHRKKKWVWFGSGMTYGTLMGIARMTQGAHFASDVIWAGGLTYLSAALLDHVFLPDPDKIAEQQQVRSRKLLGTVTLSLTLAGLIGFFLVATPYFKKWEKKYLAPDNISHVKLKIGPMDDDIRIIHADQKEALIIRAELLGFGYPKLNLIGNADAKITGNTLVASATFDLKGLVTERSGEIIYSMKKGLYLSLDTESIGRSVCLGSSDVPSYLGPVRLIERKASIDLNLAEGTVIEGPLTVITEDEPLTVHMTNIKDPGSELWKLGAAKGDVHMTINQTVEPDRFIRLFSWARYSNYYFNATVGTHCGLNMKWDEKKGKSFIIANGAWQQEPNLIYGPTGMIKANMETLLVTSTGKLNLKVYQGEGEALIAVATPTPTMKQASAFIDMDNQASGPLSIEPVKIRKLVKPPIPAWVEDELIALPYENPEATWGLPVKKVIQPEEDDEK